MDRRFHTNNSIKEFKRKRKNTVQTYRFEEPCLEEDIKPYKRLITDVDYDTFTDSSNSTTPLYNDNNSKYIEYETSTNGCLSSDDSEYRDKYNYEFKQKLSVNGTLGSSMKTEKLNLYSSAPKNPSSSNVPTVPVGKKLFDDYSNMSPSEEATFCVDMSRFNCFNTSTAIPSHRNNLYLQSDFKNSLDSPTYRVPQLSSTPPRLQNSTLSRNNRNRSHIYKPHRHSKSVTVTHVPCKGPACTSQICCAHFCSQKCYDNQKWPIGSGGNFKTSLPDYDSCGQSEINVTDYGLPYPDHTYCRDHKDIYFTADPNIGCPPYFDLVESIFYDEKESRIKNPVPIPNFNGDPISSNGYISQTAKRGRPKRSNVVGLLNSYIFHPSSEVMYTPFIFKESIIEADRLSNEIKNQDPIVYALRQCSNLYKDVRSDIPKEVLHGSHSKEHSDIFEDMIKHESTIDLAVIDDLVASDNDDFCLK